MSPSPPTLEQDANFGSIGSFFDFHPTTGSFELNPPFVAEVMSEAVDHMHLLFSRTQHPLSFIVVVPGWKEGAMWAKLTSSPFLRRQFIVAKQDHGFCDGAQHQRRDRFRSSPFDTVIFALQNTAGAAAWELTDEIEEEVRLAMAKAVPTEAMAQRRAKEGRGFADEDGGGGVYKGKKRKGTGEGVTAARAAKGAQVQPWEKARMTKKMRAEKC